VKPYTERAEARNSYFAPVVIGARCFGHLLARGLNGVEAFDAADRSLGIFATPGQAVDALLQRGQP